MLLSADRVVAAVRLGRAGLGRDGRRPDHRRRRGHPAGAGHRHLAGTVPGFVDAHSHGGGGAAFTSGDPADAATVLATHRAHGTTSMIASLVTDTAERLEASVRAAGPDGPLG